MSEGAPEGPGDRDGPAKGNDFDVVLMHAPTEDGAGSKVLRARPGRIETGEVRPMADGKPLTPGGEVVRLERRADAKGLFDVHVDYKVPEKTDAASPSAMTGPAQVATRAYRDSWDRTFGAN
ncbi:MAG: hypothetical protein ACRENE_00350 [Polyangiaceae bacterium]